MKFSTAALLLLLPTTSTSFQFPFLPSSFRSIHTNIFQPQDTAALSAKRRKEFTDDGSPRGFAPSSSSNKRGFDLNKNGQERNITSVKDVDAALNDEIEGALASAELDLMASAASAGGGNVVAGGDSTLEIKEEVPEVKMAKMPKKEEEEPQSQWDTLKETLYDAADSLNKKMMKPPPSFAADFTPVPPETPGEKAMREWSAIDVDSISAGSGVDSLEEDVMSPEERMLLQAQREAEEAEAMLREAELESERIEKELSMFSYSTADAGGGGDEDSVVAAAAIEKEGSLVNEEEEDALASMASAYQAALDAANDNVNLLTAQIEELEVELSSALQQMESAAEDKERVSAEYAYLASNYRSYKEKMDREGDVMRDEVQDYASRVASLEEEIGKLKGELTQAQEEAAKWKSDYESIQKEMAEQLQSSLMEQKELQATLDDVTSTFESTLEDSQKEYEATLAVVTSEYDEAISQSKKMIAALRQSLRNARSEAKSKALVEEDAVKAVDDVRAKMNDEVEKLRGALKGLEGQAGQNDAAITKEREEREKLLEEIEVLKQSIEDEQNKAAASSDEYSITLEAYSKKEDELNAMIQIKNKDIDNLSAQVEAMKSEINSLESGGGDIDELLAANSKLALELEGARASLQGDKAAISSMEQKISSLEQELSTKQNLVAATQKALEETKANLDSVQKQVVIEQKSAEKLQAELKAAEAVTRAASEKEAAAANEQKEFEAKIEDLNLQLKAATEEASKRQLGMEKYGEEMQQLMGQLTQSKISGEATHKAFDELRAKLKATSEQLYKEQEAVEKVQSELNATKAKLVDMELSSKSTASEREMAAEKERRELRSQIERLDAQLKATTQRAVSGEEKIKVYEERVQSITGLLNQFESNVEKLRAELTAVKEQAQVALAKESEKNKALQSQLDQLKAKMKSSLAQADAEIQRRSDALKSKEVTEAELLAKLDLLQKNVNNAQSSVNAKTEEANAMQALVERLKADLTKEAKLREEVSEGKKGLEALLQRKVSEWQKEMADARAQAEKDVKMKSDELKQMEAMFTALKSDVVKSSQEKEEAVRSKATSESSLQSQIKQLQQEISDIKSRAGANLAAKDSELKKMEAVITQLQADVEKESRLKEEAIKGKAELDAALRKRMAQLQADMSSSTRGSSAVVEAKEKELSALKSQIGQLQQEIRAETQLKNEAIKSRDSAESSLKSKIDQLLGDISSNRAKSEATIRSKDEEINKRDSAVSTLKADLAKLLKVKDDALNERDRLEKELTVQIMDLKNNIGLTRLKADELLASERLQAATARNELERSINALQKNLADTRSNASSEIKQMESLIASLKAKVESTTEEKDAIEAKLQASITQAQVNADATVKEKSVELTKMSELAANLKKELEQQAKRVKQMEESQAKAAALQLKSQSVAASTASPTEVAESDVKDSTSSPKIATQDTMSAPTSGRGFANMKSQSQSASAAKSTATQKTVSKSSEKKQPASKLGQEIADDTSKALTPEQAESERKARLKAAEEARKLNESKRVTAALDQLSKGSSKQPAEEAQEQPKEQDKETVAKVFVGTKPKYVRVENESSRQTVSLKDLIRGKEVDKNAFPKRKQAPSPSTQAPSQPSSQYSQNASPLKNIIVTDPTPKRAFPERKKAPAPSSQGASSSVRNQQATKKTSFPERKEPPAPSSQAPSPSAVSQTGPSLKTIVAKETTTSNAFPERKASLPPSSQAPPPKRAASGDQEREGLTLRRYTQTRKASTSLGGLANTAPAETDVKPNQSASVVNKVADAAQSVPVSANKEESARKPILKSGSSFANLASLVGNGSVVNRDRSTVNQVRSVSTKLGDIAKNPAGRVTQKDSSSKSSEKENSAQTKQSTVAVPEGDPQEAFQRVLLSKQIANDKDAGKGNMATKTPSTKKEEASRSKGFSSLSAIIQGRDKRSITPTINRDRAKSSLFPEPSGSALSSRLINK